MQCVRCKQRKLSQEYPAPALSDDCDHPALWCLKTNILRLKCCVTDLPNPPACPECSHPLSKADVDFLHASLAVITQSDKFQAYNNSHLLLTPSAQVVVTQLNGEHHAVPFSSAMLVDTLKQQLAKTTGIPVSYQQLIYNKTQLQSHKNGKLMTLGDYNIASGSVVQLMRLLYAIPGGSLLDNIVFDLYWGYPVHGQDYLDATCMAYAGAERQFVVDFRNKHVSSGTSIIHSGDLMDNTTRIGHHIINVSLSKIPSNITSLFFVLSAYHCDDISLFPKPSVKLFDKSKPNEELCKYSVQSVGHSQAVVMCYLSRQSDGWRVYVVDKHSNGNAKGYTPISRTIAELFAESSVV